MKFLESYLQPGEEVKYKAEIHVFFFAEPLALFAVGCYILSGAVTDVICWLGGTVFFLGMVAFAVRLLVKAGSLYVVTNKRVILKTGVVMRRVTELVLVKCEAVQVRQGLLGRIFGYGTITVTTGGAVNCYHYVADPFSFKRAINMQIG